MCRFKQKTEAQTFSLIHLPFAHCTHGSLSLCLLTDEETNESYPFANGLNGLANL
jgi:hypothetical protein